MSETQAKAAPPPSRARRILLRILSFLLGVAIIGAVTGGITKASNHVAGPAGFGRGVLHGMLMPCALPNLIVGRDVTIYAPDNDGRLYKLGYTVGVNGCGAVFFGVLFWRVNRWRNRPRKT